MPKRIVQLTVKEGSVVPRGANQRAHIKLFKMDGAPPAPQPRTSLWKRITRPFTPEKSMDAKKKEELQKRADERKVRLAKIKDKIEAIRKRNAERQTEHVHLSDRNQRRAERYAAPLRMTGATTSETLMKSQIEKQDREITDLKKMLNEEKSIRQRTEFLAKADKIKVAGKVEKSKLAETLMKLAAHDSVLAADVEKMLTETGNAWHEAAEQLTAVLGGEGDAPASNEHQQIEQIGKGLREKNDTLTKEQAYVKALKANPELAKKLA